MTMTIEQITTHVERLGHVLTVRPGPGDGSPELAWGDVFSYLSLDGALPGGQPFATVVSKDYPGEPSSALAAGEFRVNLDAGRRGLPPCADPTVRDTVMSHPVYAAPGWVCVVQPGEQSAEQLRALLEQAHAEAERRARRGSDH